jgi:hypothetical protein
MIKRHSIVFGRAIGLLLAASVVLALAGCSRSHMRNYLDPPMNYAGREEICLHNLERLLDAKQEWAKETHAGVGSLSPSATVLAHRYFRMYEHGRRSPCDDDTQNLPVFQAICPSGGEYIIGTVGERPKCSAHGDLLRDYDQHIRVRHSH